MFDFDRPIHSITLSHSELISIQDSLTVAQAVRRRDYSYLAAYTACEQPGMGATPLDPLRSRLEEIAAPTRAEIVAEIKRAVAEHEARQAAESDEWLD